MQPRRAPVPTPPTGRRGCGAAPNCAQRHPCHPCQSPDVAGVAGVAGVKARCGEVRREMRLLPRAALSNPNPNPNQVGVGVGVVLSSQRAGACLLGDARVHVVLGHLAHEDRRVAPVDLVRVRVRVRVRGSGSGSGSGARVDLALGHARADGQHGASLELAERLGGVGVRVRR
eukprot:scaffold5148_cov35-Phaeocystis_antarctica.AAC.2